MTMQSARKALHVIRALAGHEVNGLAPAEIATAAGLSPSAVTHYRDMLIEEGMVEPVPGIAGRYRLGPRLVQIARAYDAGLQRAQGRLAETEQRFSRQPF